MQNDKRRPHQENKEYSALQWGFWPTTRLLFNWDSTLAADNRVSQRLQLSIYLPFSSIGIPVWRIDRRSKQNRICTNRSKHLPQVFVVRHGSCMHLTFLFSLPFPLSHHKSKPYFRYAVIIRSFFFYNSTNVVFLTSFDSTGTISSSILYLHWFNYCTFFFAYEKYHFYTYN